MSIELGVLPYAYEALEPYFYHAIRASHHQAYVDNYKKTIARTELECKTIEVVLNENNKHSPVIRSNGGRYHNYSYFWKILSSQPQLVPDGKLLEAINNSFGSLEQLKEEINKVGLDQRGAGWAWLLVKDNGSLMVSYAPDPKNSLMDTNIISRGFPILGVDVWEHAYYLKYQNKRTDYFNAFWSMLDWSAVGKEYAEVLQKKIAL